MPSPHSCFDSLVCSYSCIHPTSGDGGTREMGRTRLYLGRLYASILIIIQPGMLSSESPPLTHLTK